MFLFFDFANLGADPQVRSWISFYIRNSQKRHNEALVAFRTKLLDQLKSLVKEAKVYEQRNGAISQHVVVRASAILRLYTALKGIAGLKYVNNRKRFHLLYLQKSVIIFFIFNLGFRMTKSPPY